MRATQRLHAWWVPSPRVLTRRRAAAPLRCSHWHAGMDRLRHHTACLRSTLTPVRRAAVAAQTDTRTPVCLVVGAGAGIGQAVARKFAQEGLHVCVVRRGGGPSSLSDDKTPKLFERFVQSIEDDGGQATAFFACVRQKVCKQGVLSRAPGPRWCFTNRSALACAANYQKWNCTRGNC